MPEASHIIRVAGGTVRMVQRAELESFPAWRSVFADKCKDHRYYEIIDQTLDNDFDFRYLILEDSAGTICGIQPVFFLRQNLVEGMHGPVRSLIEQIRRKFPRFLTMRVLVAGCAAGEGHLGTVDSKDEAWMAETLRLALRYYARENKVSLIVLKDFSSAYRERLENFAAGGYARVPSMPMTRLSLQHKDFDAYLSRLGYITRKGLRRKFRKAERSAPIEMEVLSDCADSLEALFPLYLQVHKRSPMKFENLSKDYFRALSAQMPDRVRFFIWRQEGRIIAFSCCLVHGGKIYDECLGLDYGVALDLHLYFYTLRDVLKWAMSQGLEEYVSGPLNYDPKLHLGCELMPLDLYVTHTSVLLNPIFRRVVNFLEPTRHDPILQRFPNAHELRP